LRDGFRVDHQALGVQNSACSSYPLRSDLARNYLEELFTAAVIKMKVR
jgi:hypothetical protein